MCTGSEVALVSIKCVCVCVMVTLRVQVPNNHILTQNLY